MSLTQSSEHLKSIILESKKCNNKHVIANFYMKTVYPDEGDYGHFSPIVSANDDECCIGDVWPPVPDYTWLTYEKLYTAVNTIDSDSGRPRGLIVFEYTTNN